MSTAILPRRASRPCESSAAVRSYWLPAVCRVAAVAALLLTPSVASAQIRPPRFTIEQVLSPAFPYGLVAARQADRIAWIENERGMRNVYTAAAPDFRPVPLTATAQDDGVDLTSLQISDDGSVVVFIRGHTPNDSGWIANPASDPRGGRREIWAASTSGTRPPWRVVAALDAYLSPDGKWVLHVRGGQIHRAPVDPGNADPALLDDAPPLFRDFGSNGNPAWSPDGRKIAFVTDRGDHSFVAVYDMHSRRISYLAPSVDRDTGPVWSPDGGRIAFLRRPGLPYGTRATVPRSLSRDAIPAGFLEATFPGGYTLGIWVADVATGDAEEIWHNPPGDSLFAEVTGLRWAGDQILFQAEPSNWRHWFSVSVSSPGRDAALLTPGEGEVEHVTVSPDGRWLYYTSNLGDLDRRNLWRVPVAGGRPERLTGAPTIETFPAMLGSGQHVAVLQSGPRQPLSVAILPPTGGTARRIGPRLPAEFPAAQLVEPQSVEITAADGVRAHSLLFLPPDLRPGERRPALVFVHGGPAMQTVLGYHYQGPHGFYHMVYGVTQYLVNRGYIVLSVNYRAGTGYGRAFRLAPERRAEGNSEYRDVLAAGLWLKQRPDVDPQRIGIWGLSYGGWLTGQALSRNSDLFAAGVDIAGVQYRSTSLDREDLAYQSSPAYNIERWRSPVLVIQGDDDRNVEFSQTVGLIQLLRAHGIPHELIVYPNDTHYFQVFGRWIRAFNALDDFFDRTLIRKEGVRVTQGRAAW